MEGTSLTPAKKKNSLLLAARIFATLLALFFSLALLPKLVGQYIDTINGKPLFEEPGWEGIAAGWEGLVMELTYYVFMTGFIFSWWKKCTGGILMICAGLIQMLPFLIIDGNMGSLIFGIPMLIAGTLLLVACKGDSR
jgi:hypothetical protein